MPLEIKDVFTLEITLSFVFSAVGAVTAFLVSNAKFQERLEQLTARYEKTKTDLEALTKEKNEIMLKVKMRDEEMAHVHEFITDTKNKDAKHDSVHTEVTELRSAVKHMTQEIADMKAVLNRIEINQLKG